MLVFEEREKTGVPGEKTLRTIRLNPHEASTPGFQPGPHWWEASALTTAPPLVPDNNNTQYTTILNNNTQILTADTVYMKDLLFD